jgi:protein-tyrosine phosphatase
MDRHIPFTAVHNFRDLGGYPTLDGRQTRWRRLFRADALQALTPDEAAWLREDIGLRLVIDMQGSTGVEPGSLVANGVSRPIWRSGTMICSNY